MSLNKLSNAAWRKSSRSQQGGTCVEVAYIDATDAPVEHKHAAELVVIRDSTDPSGPVLFFTEAEWNSLIGGIRRLPQATAGPAAFSPRGKEATVCTRMSETSRAAMP